ETARVYGDGQRILGRWRRTNQPGMVAGNTNEFALFRIGPDTLDSRFDLPRCLLANDPGFDCNPYR
ncbi:MAG: hypothetical protein KIS89_05845, partial [Dokdonella sp.]|nr:hypothetical protein [Dokdonella sp.]